MGVSAGRRFGGSYEKKRMEETAKIVILSKTLKLVRTGQGVIVKIHLWIFHGVIPTYATN